MSSLAIRIQNVGKEYQLGIRERGYQTLRESIINTLRAPWRRMQHLSGRGDAAARFWALRDVSLDVPRGEVVGIIGHNGAGKSTLLKILSQITEPTTGRVELWGRVASLLEVGTGFHPELTGRENIFLNGAILGMSKSEIQAKFDEIVDFAGVEEFLDTPVKRYSSGMHVRLAFAVAAHLEPEILVVDEVLAVGDAEFQSKCIGKMGEVAKGGRTVLFVSHNMAAIESLCTSAALLNSGRLECQGPTASIISRYFKSVCQLQGDMDLANFSERPSGRTPILRRLRIASAADPGNPSVPLGDSLHLEFELAAEKPIHDAILLFRVQTGRGLKLFTCSTRNDLTDRFDIQGTVRATCVVRNIRLQPGRYEISVALKNALGDILDEIPSGPAFEVVASNVNGSGRLPPPTSGVLIADSSWNLTADRT